MGVARNERADEMAGETAEKLGKRQCEERFGLLAHVSWTIPERKWKEAKH